MSGHEFRRGRSGWIHSSEGYSVRLMGRTDLQYTDPTGDLHIPAEAMRKPWNDVVVGTKAIPDVEDRPRSEVVERPRRAFEFAGWNFLEADE